MAAAAPAAIAIPVGTDPIWQASLEEALMEQPAFHDLRAAQRMRISVGLPPLLSALPPPSAAVAAKAGQYESMREEQNRAWARESVARGVERAKAGNLDAAIASYEHALV